MNCKLYRYFRNWGQLQKCDIKLLLAQENQAIIDRVFQNAGTISAALGSQYSGMVAGSSLPRKCMAQCRAGLLFDKTEYCSGVHGFRCSGMYASAMLESDGGGPRH